MSFMSLTSNYNIFYDILDRRHSRLSTTSLLHNPPWRASCMPPPAVTPTRFKVGF
jgi:hypothetical protein